MRVVRIVTRLNRGGPLRQLCALVPGLARRGVTGPVLVGEPAAGEEDASDDLARLGVEIVRVPGLARGLAPTHDWRAFRWLLACLRRTRPDVVHTHMGKAGALGRLAARAAGVPVRVHTFHGHHLSAPFPAGVLSRGAERLLGTVTTCAVALSPLQRRDLVVRHHVLPDRKVAVVGPGVDLDAMRAAVDPARVLALRAQLAAPGRRLAVWLGRFVPPKDPRLLVRALRILEEDGRRPVRVVMAGDGPMRRAVMAEAADLVAAGAVVFPGAVASPASLLAAGDLVVLSSRSEGTPIALLEAAALGVPAVSTAVGGVPDVLRDRQTGLLCAPGDAGGLADALATLARDPALRARLGATAQREADGRFGAARLVDETLALYRRLLGLNGGGPPGGG